MSTEILSVSLMRKVMLLIRVQQVPTLREDLRLILKPIISRIFKRYRITFTDLLIGQKSIQIFRQIFSTLRTVLLR